VSVSPIFTSASVGIDGVEHLDFPLGSGGHHANPRAAAQPPIEDAHQHDGTDVGIEPGVEDQRPRGPRGISAGRGNAFHDQLEKLRDADALLGGNRVHVGGVQAQHLLDLLRHAGGVRGREIDLVDHRDDLEAGVDGEVGVGQGLRLDPLSGVHHQDRPLTGLEGARDLVGEVDVARRVDQVELVVQAVPRAVDHARGLRLDRDPALALEIHVVEELRPPLALGKGAGGVEQAIGQGALSVVDVRHDAEVADAPEVRHGFARVALCGARGEASEAR
jgi:hypothetical protein